MLNADDEKGLKELVVSIAKKHGIEVVMDENGDPMFKKEDETKLTTLVVNYISQFREAK
jgi:MoaA/NifB/PqqE/SkfB family radical SAM enzyme